jgi:hypothetical protein
MNLFNLNELNNYQIIAIISMIIFTIVYIIKLNNEYLTKKDKKELFTDIIQNEAYICKTNNNIFDKHYIDLYNLIYYDREINSYIFDRLNETIFDKNSKNNRRKNINNKKNINFLIIWPNHNYFIKQFNKYHYSSELIQDKYIITKKIATQNNYLNEYFKKLCNCETFSYDILTLFTFDLESFTHIILNNFNIYKLSFKDQLILIDNISRWCKTNGYFIIYLLNEEIFEDEKKNPLFNLNNSSNVNNGNLQFDKFNINTSFRYGDTKSKYKNISVKEELELKLDNDEHDTKFIKKRRAYEYCLNITPIDVLLEKIVKCDFAIVDKYPLSVIHPYYKDHYLYIFKKNNRNSSYNEY